MINKYNKSLGKFFNKNLPSKMNWEYLEQFGARPNDVEMKNSPNERACMRTLSNAGEPAELCMGTLLRYLFEGTFCLK